MSRRAFSRPCNYRTRPAGPTAELCTKGAGYVEDIIARTDAACLIDIHLKRTSYQEALHASRLCLEGPRQLTEAFLTWVRPSPYVDIVPARLEPAVGHPPGQVPG